MSMNRYACTRLRAGWLAAAAAFLCGGVAGVAQVPVKHPAFEVVSIRPHDAASGPVQRPGPTADGFRSIGLPLFGIFQWAYPLPGQGGLLRGDLITGAPRWLFQDSYDIVARVSAQDLADWQKPEMRQTMLRAMLQAMLAERCKVVAHYESREMPVYDLVIAKGGPKFKAAETVDPDELRKKFGDGGMLGTNVRVGRSANGMQYYAIPMAILAQTLLPNMAGRPVVDKTGLNGYYDLTLPDIQRPLPPPSTPGEPQLNGPPPAPGDDESIFTVLPEALGLRLEPAKGLVEMLVIDHVEPPTEN